jgi:hypothetical protein
MVVKMLRKIERYELFYIMFCWWFILSGVLYFAISKYLGYTFLSDNFGYLYYIIYFASIASMNLYKFHMIRLDKFGNFKVYAITRTIEFMIFLVGFIFLDIDPWTGFVTVILVLITSLSIGAIRGIYFVASLSFLHLLLYVLFEVIHRQKSLTTVFLSVNFFINCFYYFALILLTILCGKIYSERVASEEKNALLLDKLKEKYQQLAIAQDEIKFHFEKVQNSNAMLEDTNKKLQESIAEFFTLQQISNAISSIYDSKELLKYVNDIIIGVMGVTYSTIILYDQKNDILSVQTTNIKNSEELLELSNNINCGILKEVLKSGNPIIENYVDSTKYVFTSNREINSFICMPLSSKTDKFGLVLIEHKHNNAFDKDKLRLLDIIGQQIGIAMENVELYQRLQELANTDSLTGVYNRLYLQERLMQNLRRLRTMAMNCRYQFLMLTSLRNLMTLMGIFLAIKLLKASPR